MTYEGNRWTSTTGAADAVGADAGAKFSGVMAPGADWGAPAIGRSTFQALMLVNQRP